MAKISYVERLLIALNEDGTVKGAAQYKMTKWDDPEIPDKPGDAEPLDPAAIAVALPAQAALLAQVGALQAACRAETSARQDAEQALEATRVALQTERETVAARDAALEAQRAEFHVRLSDAANRTEQGIENLRVRARQEIETLESRIALLTAELSAFKTTAPVNPDPTQLPA